MLQPVGGMDRIAHAIYDQVKPAVRLRTPVSAIRRMGNRVRIEHGPGKQMTEADYCICTLPLPIAGADSERLLGGEEGGASWRASISPQRQARVRGAALLGDRRQYLRRPRLDRPAERERDLPLGRDRQRRKA